MSEPIKAIWKQPISLGRYTVKADEILHVGTDVDGYACVWFTHSEASKPITLDVVGTGWNVPERSHYRGTANQGGFTWHVFEIAAGADDAGADE